MGRIYQFDEEHAIRFARERGLRVRRRGDELLLEECPYCHGGQNHSRFNFAINTKTGAWNCPKDGCGKKGSFLTLCKDWGFEATRDMAAYEEIAFKRFRVIDRKIEPEDVRDEAVEYLGKRGIREETVRKYRITARKDRPDVLVFPFMDAEGQIQFIKYRNTQRGKSPKEWCESNCKPILFGMWQCNMENRTLIITEGQIDSLSVAECGIENAVSVPTGAKGMTWVPHCWDWLQKFDTLIVFGDFEHGSMTLLADMKCRFNGIVKHVRYEDYLGCKDANEILQKHGPDAVRNAVERAIVDPNKHIIRMSDVVPENPFDQECISTGFSEFDSTVGGLYFGQLAILTGERGQGKSTLGSQIVAQALRQGYSALIYSGELKQSLCQNWIDRQLSAGEGLTEYTTRLGKKDWKLEEWEQRRLHLWYSESLWVYDSADLDEDEEQETLIDTLREAVSKQAIRVLLVDNLMTAIDDLGSDINIAQTRFVKALARIALEFNALILLVAHPRKNSGGTMMANDDVMGSGNITNAASLVMQYTRPTDGSADRVLRVTKNRGAGDLIEKGISLWYDPATKRISDLPGQFVWSTDEAKKAGFAVEVDEDLPF